MKSAAKISKRSMLPSSPRHRKDAHKFHFSVLVRKIHIPPRGEFYVRMSRGSKSTQTTTLKNADPTARHVDVDQTLNMLCTLYRSKGYLEGGFFQEKDFKMAIVSTTGDRTIVKAHFNAARYAGVPSAETVDTLSLGTAVKLDVRFTVRMVQNVGPTKSATSSRTSDVDSVKGDLSFSELIGDAEGLELDDLLSPVTPMVESHRQNDLTVQQFQESAETLRLKLKDEQRRSHQLEQLFSSFKVLFSTLVSERKPDDEVVDRAWVTYREISLSFSELKNFQNTVFQSGKDLETKNALPGQRHVSSLQNEKNSSGFRVGESQNGEGQCCDCSMKVKVLTESITHDQERISQLEAENTVIERKRFVMDMDVTEYKQQLEKAKERERSMLKEKDKLERSFKDLEKRLEGRNSASNHESADRDKRVKKEKELKKVIRQLQAAVEEAQSREAAYCDELRHLTHLSKDVLQKLKVSVSTSEDIERGKASKYPANNTAGEHGGATVMGVEMVSKLENELLSPQLMSQKAERRAATLSALQKELDEKECLLEEARIEVDSLKAREALHEQKVHDVSREFKQSLDCKTQQLIQIETQLSRSEADKTTLESQSQEQLEMIRRHEQDIKKFRENENRLMTEVKSSKQHVQDFKRIERSNNEKVESLKSEVLELTMRNNAVVQDTEKEISRLRKTVECSGVAEKAQREHRARKKRERLTRADALEQEFRAAHDRMQIQERQLGELEEFLQDNVRDTDKKMSQLEESQEQGAQKAMVKLNGALSKLQLQQGKLKQQNSFICSLQEDITVGIDRDRVTKAELDNLTAEFDTLQNSMCTLSVELESKKGFFNDLSSKNETQGKSLCEMTKELNARNVQIDVLEENIAKQKHLHADNEKLSEELLQVNTVLQPLHKKHVELEEEFNKVSAEFELLTDSSVKQDAIQKALQEENETLRTHCESSQQEVETHLESLSTLRMRLEQSEQQQTDAMHFTGMFENEMTSTRECMFELQHRVDRAEEQLVRFENDATSLQEVIFEKKALKQNIDTLENQVMSLQKDRTEFLDTEDKLEKLHVQAEHLQESLDSSKTTNVELSSVVASLQSKVFEAETVRKERDELRLRFSSLSKARSDLEEDLAKAEMERSELLQQLQDTKMHAVNETAIVNNLSAVSSELNMVKEINRGLENRVSALNKELFEAHAQANAAAEYAKTEMAQMSESLNDLSARDVHAQEELHRKRRQIAELEERLSATAKQAVSAKADLVEAQQREKGYQQDINKLREEVDTMRNEVEAKTAELAMVQMEREIQDAEMWDDDDVDVFVRDEAADTFTSFVRNGSHNAGTFNKEIAPSIDRNTQGKAPLPEDHDNTKTTILEETPGSGAADSRVLDMLVETKMQLAQAEEGKVQLEHLIHRIQDGDDYMRCKIAEYVTEINLILGGGGAVNHFDQPGVLPTRPSSNGQAASFERRVSSRSERAPRPFLEDGRLISR